MFTHTRHQINKASIVPSWRRRQQASLIPDHTASLFTVNCSSSGDLPQSGESLWLLISVYGVQIRATVTVRLTADTVLGIGVYDKRFLFSAASSNRRRKATISFVMSVHTVQLDSAWRIFVKFYIFFFKLKYVDEIRVCLKSGRNSRHVPNDVRTSMSTLLTNVTMVPSVTAGHVPCSV